VKDFIIQSAETADAGQISSLLHASWHRTYDALMGGERVAEASARTHDLAKLKNEIVNADIITLVALQEGNICGVIKADKRADGELYIDRLHLAPHAFASGLADQLITAAIAKMAGVRILTLDVLAGNERAIAYYKKVGFVETKLLPADGSIIGVPMLLMEKRIF
jgi:ribosomal protein S18 acetylase RimI-like enzyme